MSESVSEEIPNEVGLLSGREYAERRSATLLHNPEAKLNEAQELQLYLSKDANYLRELQQLNEGLEPMNYSCRAVVCIPATNEAENIIHALSLYTQQRDKNGTTLSPDLFEIIIFDNHPNGTLRDDTAARIEAFVQEHPELHVNYVYRECPPDEEPTIGRARKYVSDLAALRGMLRGNETNDLILISNGAAMLKLKEQYLTEILAAFDTNPHVDALTARWRLPRWALEKPNLLAASNLWYFIDHIMEKGAIGDLSQRQKEPVGLIARNAAMRASIYSAVGGYNPQAKTAEDLEIGWMISDAREWDPDRVIYLNGANIEVNPRRFIATVASHIPLTEMNRDFYMKPEIRHADTTSLLRFIPDDLDMDKLEMDADAFWQSRNKGQYKWLGDKFPQIFSRAMGHLGVDYVVVDGHIHVTNVEKLLQGMSKKLGREIKALPRTPNDQTNTYTEKGLDNYFSGIAQGFLESRALKAIEITNRIEAVIGGKELIEGDKNKLAYLLKQYQRFAGVVYDPKHNVKTPDWVWKPPRI